MKNKKRQVRIEAVSEIYMVCETLPYSKAVSKLKLIRKCYEAVRLRELAKLLAIYTDDNKVPMMTEANKAKFEFANNDKYRLKVKIQVL
jgi:hypothetical protein